jgi:hypothetical protein
MSAAEIASSDEVDTDCILAGRTTVTLTPILARAVPAYVSAETSKGARANSSAVRTPGVAKRTPVLPGRSKKDPTATFVPVGPRAAAMHVREASAAGPQSAWHSLSATTPGPERVIPPGPGVHDFTILVVETHGQYGCSPFS